MSEIKQDGQQSSRNKELLQPMIDAFIASARHTLEYAVIKYSMKRYQSFLCIKSYYRKKLYKAILELREFNKENPE